MRDLLCDCVRVIKIKIGSSLIGSRFLFYARQVARYCGRLRLCYVCYKVTRVLVTRERHFRPCRYLQAAGSIYIDHRPAGRAAQLSL